MKDSLLVSRTFLPLYTKLHFKCAKSGLQSVIRKEIFKSMVKVKCPFQEQSNLVFHQPWNKINPLRLLFCKSIILNL